MRPPKPIPAAITTNPHSQILTVAIQLGLVGSLALIAMWIAHLALFRDRMSIAWFGSMIVAENIVSSFFNSHLFDFSQGWLYVLRRRGRRRVCARWARGRAQPSRARHEAIVPTMNPGADLGRRADGQDHHPGDQVRAHRRIRASSRTSRASLTRCAPSASATASIATMLDRLSAELKRVNRELWDVEDVIRECDARGDFGEKFVRACARRLSPQR